MRSKLIYLIGFISLVLCTAMVCADDSSLRVTGIGTVQVPADTAIILVSAHNESNNLTMAATSNSELLNAIEKSLIAEGVRKEEIMPDRRRGYITSRRVVCNKANNTTTCRDVAANRATEQLILRVKTIDSNKTEKLLDVARSNGADAEILRYALSDSSKAVEDARKKALKDAKAIAEDYASSFGLNLGKALEIEEPIYPYIEVGPTYKWDMPMRMHHAFWMRPFHRTNGLLAVNYIPKGMAEVTAYVSVIYSVAA
ncbi:MAG: oxidative stress defense protein [Methanosaeta sp. PtaU1.Bin112]|nr:MAG: oxidative stress defense protein [Methanosaeta sp. PtaU1.Bin112]